MSDNVQGLLQQYAGVKATAAGLGARRIAELMAIMTPEQQERYGQIEADYAAQELTLAEQVKALDAEIRLLVMTGGESVKAHGWICVYNKPRELWDGKGLSGYAVAHPEVLQFKTMSGPSAAIREAK